MHVVLLAGLGLPLVLKAQLEIPVPLVLDGALPEQRQITGLANPLSPDAGMSLRALRNTSANFTAVNGFGSITGDLVPAPTAYTAGMTITIVPDVANAPAATLDLNNLGPRFILKQGGLPLDSADLRPGVPARLIYDGERFQLISSTQIPCPTGFTDVTREYCIENSARTAVSFFAAISACGAADARLCTIGEWSHACRKLPGFLGSVSAAEWVDHAANNVNGAKLVGAGSNGEEDLPGIACEYGGQSPPTGLFRFRCCTHR